MREATSFVQPQNNSLAGDLLTVVVPTLLFLEMEVGGRLFVSELILLAILPMLLATSGHALSAKLPRTFLVLGGTWLVAQIASDLINSIPFEDYARGWAKIAFTLSNFAALYLLLHGNWRRLLLFAAGWAIGGLLTYVLSPSAYAEGDPWKFGIGTGVTVLVILLAQGRQVYASPFLSISILSGLVVLNLAQGFRSLAGICFLSAGYLLVQQVLQRRRATSTRLSLWRLGLFSCAALAISMTFIEIYSYAAKQGYLGEQSRMKYESQTGAYGLVLGGRVEIFVSSQAIIDAPVFGHGSWAKGPEYAAMLLQLRDYGYQVGTGVLERGLIPTHSHLFGAWVESGIVGAIFWAWALMLAARVLANLYSTWPPLVPMITFFGFMFVWDVLFSPFGAERRVFMPFCIILFMTTQDWIEGQVRLQNKPSTS